MRITRQNSHHFDGTHKGHEIEIDREPDGRFYIIVRCLKSGLCAYDGWAPEDVRTMPAAKREALRGACL
jgi:hypothetical protein